MSKFKALIADQKDSQFTASIQEIDQSQLPAGEVLIRVAFSSLNYKDGLAVTGKPGVIRKFPMVPGVDFAGMVVESSSASFHPGDEVVVTGCGTSEIYWGGYAQYARLDAEHIVPLPKGMTLKQAMGIGTAGFTAMQSVLAMEHQGLKPSNGEVLVTGAAGGVGSVAVAILAKLGYKVVASTGRAQFTDYLKALGAAEVVDRGVISAASKKLLESARWAGAIDSVGGETLSGVLRSMQINGVVAACGLAGGPVFTTSVMPFIIRGVSLLGIDSTRVPNAQRRHIWARLMSDLPMDHLDSMIVEAPLDKVFALGEQILKGLVRGRVVVNVNA